MTKDTIDWRPGVSTNMMASEGSSKTADSSARLNSWQRSRKRYGNKSLRGENAKPGEKPIKIMRLEDFNSSSSVEIQIQHCAFLASYNWTKANEPTVFVPGAPALWTPPALPFTIPKDDGKAIQDQNSNRIMAPSFAPFFAALLILQPSYSLLPIALVTDRNSLRKLFDFASGHPKENWRIEVEIIKETVFLTRWESNPSRIITGSFHSGYGHEFENACLKFEEGLEESSTHHRIEEYEIGGMKWVVRFEADGYFKDDPRIEEQTVGVSQLHPEISATMEALSLKPDSMPRTLEGVGVIQKGWLVSPSSIIEVKCVGKKSSQLGKKTPQCWFSQTKHLFVGHLKDGLVEKVTKTEMSSRFEDWEKTHQDELRKLVALIKEVRGVARQLKDGKCCLVCHYKETPRVLRIFKSEDSRLMLSTEVKERYW